MNQRLLGEMRVTLLQHINNEPMQSKLLFPCDRILLCVHRSRTVPRKCKRGFRACAMVGATTPSLLLGSLQLIPKCRLA